MPEYDVRVTRIQVARVTIKANNIHEANAMLNRGDFSACLVRPDWDVEITDYEVEHLGVENIEVCPHEHVVDGICDACGQICR